uniref:Ubiquitin carboxyl-terminal hydrolase 39 n=1 Tax=Syphacia muris TaxID=451379 RepID=A0A0N5ARZ5_9BILA
RNRSVSTKNEKDDRIAGTNENKKRKRHRSPDHKTASKEESVERKSELVETDAKKPPTARDLEIVRLMKEEEQRGGNIDVDDEPVWSLKKAQIEKPSRQCPYLDTIDRGALDFDFEKLCSVSLSHVNAYACMICGKYFQGRGTNTHAYTHSLETDHRVFLNLSTLKFYCLPDNYEIIDPSLDDIKYVLKPTYTKQYINSLDRVTKMSRAFDGTPYYPGVVGLNNIKANDYENVVLHALSHVPPLRNYFLREENYAMIKRPPGDKLALLPKRFGELIRKLWNPKAFKAHVSPHEMLQATVICSNKKFQITKQGNSAEFLNFLLNTLHIALNGTKKGSSSIVYQIFRGRMREYTRKVIPVETTEEARKSLLETDEFKEKMKETPFLYLTLNLPAAPLYRDELMQNIIPQVPLNVLLTKFNGITEKEYKTYNENFMKRFELIQLPQYLIITYERFHKNQWFIEKNPTIVNFPISNVDLYDCLAPEFRSAHKYTTYDLVSNIVHDGKPESGSYRVQLIHNSTQKWYELEDLHVKEILPQMITLAESYIQIWRLNMSKTREQRTGEIGDDNVASVEIPKTS